MILVSMQKQTALYSKTYKDLELNKMQFLLRYAALIVNMKVTVFCNVTLSNLAEIIGLSEVASAAIIKPLILHDTNRFKFMTKKVPEAN